MNKTEIKKATNNKLIIALAGVYAVIVSKNGQKCKTENKKLNEIANELLNRNLLNEDDIEYLNK